MSIRNSRSSSDLSDALLRHSRIPKLYWTAEAPQGSSAASFISSLRDHLKDGRGLLLLGQHGVGKTHQACSIARAALRLTPRVLFTTAPDLIDSYKPKEAPVYFDPDYRMTFPQAYRNRRLLVIDDLGSEYKGSESGFAEQTLINLIRFRTVSLLSTVFTSNYTAAQIREIYGEGFASLLAEKGTTILIKGNDRRRDPSRSPGGARR